MDGASWRSALDGRDTYRAIVPEAISNRTTASVKFAVVPRDVISSLAVYVLLLLVFLR